MYTLQVFYGASAVPQETHEVKAASEALTLIPHLLKQHEGCEKIVVMVGHARLFAVDCKGNRLP